jgi:general secretion pathway protein A
MYLDFYGFREKPFNLTPDPRFVFLSKNHKEAFAHLLYGINHRAGFILLTGEVGSGKTTVLRALLSQFDADHYRTALIFNPCLSASMLLQNINREFGIPTYPSDDSNLLDALNPFLLQQNVEGRTVILVIDEAQDLEPQVLEQIRLISNLETDRDKLIQIVLSGQPEFLEILKRKEMQQLSQRITVRYHLQPLDFEDTVAYIQHRLEIAGKNDGVVFAKEALNRIYRYSRGLPRLINAACDRALLAGYSKDTTRITSRIAATGIKDIKGMTTFSALKRRLIFSSGLILLLVLFVVGVYYKRQAFTDLFQMSRDVEIREALTGEKLSQAMADELGKVPESESVRKAFNTLAGFWNVPPVSESEKLERPNSLEREALVRGLYLYRFSGNLGTLLRIDYPSVIELNIPGIQGKRFVVLTGLKNKQILIDPPISQSKAFSFSEVERHWSGQGFLLWKDPLNLLKRISPRSKGDPVKHLQDLLTEAGVYNRPLTDVYDSDTLSAVKAFQSSKGIEQDGIVGAQTLMLLYRSVDRLDMPRLTGEKK